MNEETQIVTRKAKQKEVWIPFPRAKREYGLSSSTLENDGCEIAQVWNPHTHKWTRVVRKADLERILAKRKNKVKVEW